MFGEIVKVEIGTDGNNKTFSLYKGVLCFYSGYFDRALSGGFLEARNGAVILPTEDVDIFERFVLWLYNRQLDLTHPKEEHISGTDLPSEAINSLENTHAKGGKKPKGLNTLLCICKIWAFADRHEIPLLMNITIDAFREQCIKFRDVIPTSILIYIYTITVPGAGLRRLILDIIFWTRDTCEALSEKRRHHWPAEALWELAIKATAKHVRDSESSGTIVICDYHQHENGLKCSNLAGSKRKRQTSPEIPWWLPAEEVPDDEIA